MLKNKSKKGYGLVEIIVGSAIVATVMVSAVFAVNSIRQLDAKTTSVIRANYLLLEGVDVVKIFRDRSWTSEISTLSLDTPYYLVWDSGAWESTTTIDVIDSSFYRTITLSTANRDVNDDIASIGSLDTGTLHLLSSVSWSYKNSTTTKTFETYITDLYAN